MNVSGIACVKQKGGTLTIRAIDYERQLNRIHARKARNRAKFNALPHETRLILSLSGAERRF